MEHGLPPRLCSSSKKRRLIPGYIAAPAGNAGIGIGRTISSLRVAFLGGVGGSHCRNCGVTISIFDEAAYIVYPQHLVVNRYRGERKKPGTIRNNEQVDEIQFGLGPRHLISKENTLLPKHISSSKTTHHHRHAARWDISQQGLEHLISLVSIVCPEEC